MDQSERLPRSARAMVMVSSLLVLWAIIAAIIVSLVP
jgi:hypothetical protein